MDQETVNRVRKEAEEAYLIYANLKEQYLSAEKDWLKKSRRFKAFDYELAQTDGRLKKIKTTDDGRKTKKQPELTLDQLQAIAAKLGVNITVNEPEETDQETINAIMEEEQC